jgi:hypothetical protein
VGERGIDREEGVVREEWLILKKKGRIHGSRLYLIRSSRGLVSRALASATTTATTTTTSTSGALGAEAASTSSVVAVIIIIIAEFGSDILEDVNMSSSTGKSKLVDAFLDLSFGVIVVVAVEEDNMLLDFVESRLDIVVAACVVVESGTE